MPTPWPPAYRFTAERCECSHRGHCDYNSSSSSFCVCDAGWTGQADFIDGTGELCHVHETTMIVLWALVLFFTAVVFLPLLLPKLCALVSAHQRTNNKRFPSVQSNPGLLGCLWVYAFGLPGVLLMGMSKIHTSRAAVLGGSHAVTSNIGWMLACVGFSALLGLLRLAELRHALRAHSDAVPDYFTFAASQQRESLALASGVALCAVYVLPMWIAPPSSVAAAAAGRVCVALLYSQLAATMFALAWRAWRVRRVLDTVLTRAAAAVPCPVVRILQDGDVEDEEAERRRQAHREEQRAHRQQALLECNAKIQFGQRRASVKAAVCGAVCLLFLLVPPLWPATEYVVPFAVAAAVYEFYRATVRLYECRYRPPPPPPQASGVKTITTALRSTRPPIKRRSTAPEDEVVDGMRVSMDLRVVRDPEDPMFLATGREEWRTLHFVQHGLASALKRQGSSNSVNSGGNDKSWSQRLRLVVVAAVRGGSDLSLTPSTTTAGAG